MKTHAAITLLLLAAAAPSAQAWDQATLAPLGPPGSVRFERLQMDAAGNGWGHTASNHLLRLQQGRFQYIAVDNRESTIPVILLTVLPDGGALVQSDVSYDGSACVLQRLDPNGRVRWTYPNCEITGVLPVADGSIWLIGLRLERLGSDGTPVQSVPEAIASEFLMRVEDGRQITAIDGGRSLIAANSYGAHDGNRPTVTRLDPGGIAWRWTHDQSWPSGIHAKAVFGADGSVQLSGFAGDKLQALRIGPDGVPRWINRDLPLAGTGLAPPSVQLQQIAHADGSSALLVSDPYDDRDSVLLRLDAAGRFAATTPLPLIAGENKLLRSASDGSTLIAGSVRRQADFRFYRVDAVGRIATERTLVGTRLLDSGNGFYLVTAGAHQPLARIDDDGAEIASAYSGQTLAAGLNLLDSTSDAAGVRYLLRAEEETTENREASWYGLTRINADGRIAWQQGSPSTIDRGLAAANSSRVCSVVVEKRFPPNDYMTRHLMAECRDAASGERLWQREVLAHTPTMRPQQVQLLTGNRLLVVYSAESFHAWALLDSNGTIVQRDSYSYSVGTSAVSANGHTALALRKGELTGSPSELVVYAPDGRELQRVVDTELRQHTQAIDVSDNGTVVAYGKPIDGAQNARSVYYADPTRNRSWRTSLDLPDLPGNLGTLQLSDDAVYLAANTTTSYSASREQPADVQLFRFDAATGSRRWQITAGSSDSRGRQLLPSLDGNQLMHVQGVPGRIRIDHYNARTGERVQRRYEDCAAIDCDPQAAATDTDGALRVVAHAYASGLTAAVYTRRNSGTTTQAIAPGQAGITGAWWSPYANGEGIAVDWLPASRTLFGAWFTYRTEGGNDPAGLRWYTLQANGVGGDARELTLPILSTDGGNFDAGPPVSPRQVGTARLRFDNCSSGILDYRFDAGTNAGAEGTVTLSRLSPATQPCILADGSSQPAAGARPPSKGFDARQSGNWYDPATGGQGLQFTVQPDGVFFAPWFTFDPADTNNDAGRQHWFTLQGDLSTAVNGQVELLLVQTIGGTFDRVPTYNANAVGTATLRLLACDRAELDYRFGDDAGAGPFRTRSGTVRLQRAGGCAP